MNPEAYANWSKPDAEGQILYESTYMRCLQQSNSPETRSRTVVTQGLGEGGNELLFNG